MKTPHQVWIEAGEDFPRYRELMITYGLVVPNEPCAECGETFWHRHDRLDPDRVIRLDIFGHDQP